MKIKIVNKQTGEVVEYAATEPNLKAVEFLDRRVWEVKLVDA